MRKAIRKAWLCIKYGYSQPIGNIILATDHRDACFLWEGTMLKAIGHDHVLGVAKKIEELKARNEEMHKMLCVYEELVPQIMTELNDLKAKEVAP